MSGLSFEVFRQFLGDQIRLNPPPNIESYIKSSANFAGFAEFTEELLAEFLAPEHVDESQPQPETQPEPQPFLLFQMGNVVSAGSHLSPEFHVIFEGWDGTVEVEATLSAGLDQHGWVSNPKVIPLERIWRFHQTIRLTTDSNDCRPGDYLIDFTCHFRNSGIHRDSSWYGSFKFQVAVQRQGELIISTEGNSLVNLSGDLLSLVQDFRTIRIDGAANSLVNLQAFESALGQTAQKKADATTTMTTIKLIRIRNPEPVVHRRIARPCVEGRFDLPDGRRVLIYARDQVILGRNRPKRDPAAPTDIALRLWPENEVRAKLNDLISRQHLWVTARNGEIEFRDQRSATSAEASPAHVNGVLLQGSRTVSHSSGVIEYSTSVARPLNSGGVDHGGVNPGINPGGIHSERRLIGLSLRSFQQAQGAVQRTYESLRRLVGTEDFNQTWRRHEAGLDAVLIERGGNMDELNGREAYLLVLGMVMMGTNHDCPCRIPHRSIRPDHAILCHWDGQFRILPLEEAFVACDGRTIQPGKIGTISIGSKLQLGDLELTFDGAEQFGLEGDSRVIP